MAPLPTPRSISIATFTLLLLITSAEGFCPENAADFLIYSPFQPYFTWPWWNNSRQSCWTAADCLLQSAGESRKQQFGATALVMGLIPLVLKDVAWPQRRVVHVTEPLNIFVEILVLALGLVPEETGSLRETRALSRENNMLARRVWKLPRVVIAFWIAMSCIGVLTSYGALAVMEIYSKRSALGCPFPVWVVCWYVVGLAPATVHALFAALRKHRVKKQEEKHGEPQQGTAQWKALIPEEQYEMEEREASQARQKPREPKKSVVQAVQGANEEWPVQLSWGLYYIAGTLIYTSIMAVTVAELLCWILVGFAVDGFSKLLAFFLCLSFEKTGLREEEG
ncbi:hypothetical protein K505DRAFT_325249 [Melanomma pulvis-pyrius CBS 109.77]|uniref:Uncharacterized protein n=1 Tax=Melanomma pulvis-pyrius CBS 109.77 TaxID=1314802 RepID=A0A6A6XCW5_9PLEO|nr:hypothetical protein K505DRAFT_325249 [Melanomma pulvis-pyrius CBS 109.77]